MSTTTVETRGDVRARIVAALKELGFDNVRTPAIEQRWEGNPAKPGMRYGLMLGDRRPYHAQFPVLTEDEWQRFLARERGE
jgi:hypothetical protein